MSRASEKMDQAIESVDAATERVRLNESGTLREDVRDALLSVSMALRALRDYYFPALIERRARPWLKRYTKSNPASPELKPSKTKPSRRLEHSKRRTKD